ASCAHREQRLAVDLQTVDAVLGLDVDHLATRLAEHALHRRRDHAMPMRVAKDHHAASDVRVGDQVSGVNPATIPTWTLGAELTNLPCRDANHGTRLSIV